MIRFLALSCCLGLAAAVQQTAPAQQEDRKPSLKDARAEYQTATTGYLRFLEDREAAESKLRETGTASEDEVDSSRFQLIVARSHLARLQGDSAKVQQLCREAVALREDQLGRLKRLRDRTGGFDAETDVAERQLASARFRVAQVKGKTEEAERQLRRLEEIASRELDRARRVGSEVEGIKYRLLKVRYLLARVKGDKVQSEQRLRDLAALVKATLVRLRSLQLKGASSEEEIDWPHFLDLMAQQRLAQAEDKTKRILEIQEELVSLSEQMVQRVLRSPNKTDEEIAYLKWVLALQRYRLVQAQRGQLPEYESIWELDGWTQLRHQPRG
jgi:hypothetical protein